MVDLIFDSAMLMLLLVYCFYSSRLSKEMQESAEWSLKQMRLTQFRAGFGYRISEFSKMNKMNFQTVYLSDEKFEKELVTQLLLDMKGMKE